MRALVLSFVTFLVLPPLAHAFPGFVVGTGTDTVDVPSATVVFVREDDLTAMTVAPEITGASGEVALVLPVPAETQADDARAIAAELLARVDLVSTPRLVERWERDPCASATHDGVTGIVLPGDPTDTSRRAGSGVGYGAGAGGFHGGGGGGSSDAPAPERSEPLTRGDYTVEVVVADSGATLATLLSERGFAPPAALATVTFDALTTFLIARITPTPAGGHVSLAPLRIHYHEPTLTLRTELAARLGLTTDLVVETFAERRVGTPREVLAPTSVEVAPGTEPGAVHAAILGRLFELHPSALVVEHAWVASGCEGCPGGHSVRPRDLATLGAQLVFWGGVREPERSWCSSYGSCGGGFHGRPAMVPRIRSRTLDVRGSLGRRAIDAVIHRHINEVRFCYEQELATRPELTGEVHVAFIIMPEGNVSSANIESTTLSNVRVESCIASSTRRWTFPGTPGGGIVGVRETFHLSASDGSASAVSGPTTSINEWVLTRLHTRLGAIASDVELLELEPIEGGREHGAAAREVAAEASAAADAAAGSVGGESATGGGSGATPPPAPTHARRNRFQVRYVVRHPWEGALACASPTREVWGAPMHAHAPDPVPAARDVAPLSDEALDAQLVATFGELGIAILRVEPDEAPLPVVEPAIEPPPAEPEATTGTPSTPSSAPASGCGCRAGGRAPSPLLALFALALLRRRQRS